MRHNQRALRIAIVVGGWQNILRFALAGLGVGLVTDETVANARTLLSSREAARLNESIRQLDTDEFPPDAVRRICRPNYDQNTPDLRPLASRLREMIGRSITKSVTRL